jgi:hypothetical protein
VIGGSRGFAPAQSTHQRILDRLAGDLVDEIQHIANGTAPSLVETPGSQGLRHRINVLDTAVRISTNHGVTDRLQRHLCTLLLGEYSLFGTLAFRDVRNRTLIADGFVAGVAQGPGVFEYHDLLPVTPAHAELGIANFTFRLHCPHELRPISGVPVQHRNARQRVEFLSASEAEDGDECRVDRQQSPIPCALVDTFRDAFKQAAELCLAGAQRLFCKAALDGDARQLGGMSHDLGFAGRRKSGLTAIDPKGA